MIIFPDSGRPIVFVSSGVWLLAADRFCSLSVLPEAAGLRESCAKPGRQPRLIYRIHLGSRTARRGFTETDYVRLLDAVLPLVVEEQHLSSPLALVVASARTDRVDAAPIILGLRVNLGIAGICPTCPASSTARYGAVVAA